VRSQDLKALCQEHADEWVIESMGRQLEPDAYDVIVKEARCQWLDLHTHQMNWQGGKLMDLAIL